MQAWLLTVQILQELGLVVTPKQSQIKRLDPNDLIFEAYHFPSYPNLEHLGSQTTYNLGTQLIHWDAFTSESSTATIVDYYRKPLGKAELTEGGDISTWRFSTAVPS